MQSPPGDDLTSNISALIRQGELDLLASLDHLHASELELGGRGQATATLRQCLQNQPGPYPAWAYLGYYRLGTWMLGGGIDDPLGLAHWAADIGAAIARYPTQPSLVCFGDPEQASTAIWDEALQLFQDGGDFVDDLEPTDLDHFNHWQQAVTNARAWVLAKDPQLHGLMHELQRLIIAARPGPQARKKNQSFGGATCFFLRGATIVNASWPITTAGMIELLVHEYAHAELFVLAQEYPLCLNRDDERHQVLIRSDPRPMNGILHSLYVVSRVAEILTRPPARENTAKPIERIGQEESDKILEKQLTFGASSLQVIEQHAQLTSLGAKIVAIARSRLTAASQAR